MNVVSAVANMQKELDYYKQAVKECQAVIKQLTEGPSEIEYIHPFDLSHILDTTYSSKLSKRLEVILDSDDRQIIEVGVKKYKQSIFIPAKTKNIL